MKRHPKYPYQRAEQRYNNIDEKGLKERAQMEQKATARISIGTLTFLPPKPNTKISNFTLAFSNPIPKNKLYPKLKQVFNGCWDGGYVKSGDSKPIKSIFLCLTKPIKLVELRERLKDSLEELLQPQNL